MGIALGERRWSEGGAGGREGKRKKEGPGGGGVKLEFYRHDQVFQESETESSNKNSRYTWKLAVAHSLSMLFSTEEPALLLGREEVHHKK